MFKAFWSSGVLRKGRKGSLGSWTCDQIQLLSCLGILLSRLIVNQEKETGKEFSPTGLSCIQLLSGHEVFKGMVVSINVETVSKL